MEETRLNWVEWVAAKVPLPLAPPQSVPSNETNLPPNFGAAAKIHFLHDPHSQLSSCYDVGIVVIILWLSLTRYTPFHFNRRAHTHTLQKHTLSLTLTKSERERVCVWVWVRMQVGGCVSVYVWECVCVCTMTPFKFCIDMGSFCNHSTSSDPHFSDSSGRNEFAKLCKLFCRGLKNVDSPWLKSSLGKKEWCKLLSAGIIFVLKQRLRLTGAE